ncbi:TraC family protein [Endozoicomonas sp. ONNA1]|uniref:TraC family protein n=1 Tax=Endozoicomonas sp. ONNA1 TaxID=2828740 RepID=UPI002148E6DC|nr:TraC family protein [Endozoicomonas sp. ONNA1]
MIGQFLKRKGTKTAQDIDKLSKRDQFSDFLPWMFFNDKHELFVNSDNTVGIIWECRPLTFCDMSQITAFEGLLKQDYPDGTIMQWILCPDHNIDGFLNEYKANKVRKDALAQKTVDEYAKFLRSGVNGMKSMNGIPVRNFRLLVCLKTPNNIDSDQLSLIEETLQSNGLAPRRWNSDDLVLWARRFFSGEEYDNNAQHDPSILLRKQVINSDSPLDFRDGSMVKVGKRFGRCVSPKALTKNIDPLKANKIFGGYMGRTDDARQINVPFLYSLNIIFDNQASSIKSKADVLMTMKATGSFAKDVARRVEEYSWALDKLATNEPFFKVIPSLWLFGDTEEQVRDASSRVYKIWEDQQFEMQRETRLSKVMMISSLPFGLYNTGNNVTNMDRHFMLPLSAIARFLPVQSDFQGSSQPVLAYVGRKGQIYGLDVFDTRSDNHNFFVAAGSGSGKSFSLGFLASNYYAAGAKVRIVDIGGSYEKLAKTNKGVFLDFGKENICINPFDFHYNDDKDRLSNQMSAAYVVAEMCFSGSGASTTETEWSLIKKACEWVDWNGHNLRGIDAVFEYLSTYPKHAGDGDLKLEKAIEIAKELAFNLHDFTSKGRYGRFFNGKSTFDISNDDFVVIELEDLKPQKELFSVVIMQIMNKVTEDLYLSDRSTPRFIIFEEAATLLKKNGVEDFSRLTGIVEEGYRRARKYSGSFGVVLQSLLDLKQFGELGDVILANAAYRFLLRGENHKKAIDEKMVDYPGLAGDLLCSVRNVKPRYSEMFVDTPFGKGVARLSVDPWSYWIYTSTGTEKSMFNALLEQGMEPYQAIQKLSGVQ